MTRSAMKQMRDAMNVVVKAFFLATLLFSAEAEVISKTSMRKKG
jgi:hypothetical protein